MDSIKMSTDSLNDAKRIISDFKERVVESVFKCESELKKQFNGIDDSFKKDLSEYIDHLHSLKNGIEQFEMDNNTALKERMSKAFDYSKTVYRTRNFI